MIRAETELKVEKHLDESIRIELLPEGWKMATFGDICKVQGGYAFKSIDYQSEGILLVRISNLINGEVCQDEKSVFLPESFLDDYCSFCLNKGDILIAMSGATTGKMAVYNLDIQALLNQRVGKFNLIAPKLTSSDYIGKILSNVAEQVLHQAYGGAQPNISPRELEQLPLPLPPLNEQRRIVAKIEELTAHSKRAREALEDVPKLIDQFRQSVLAAAFRGDLTAEWRKQNPDVEPASELLERIKLEKVLSDSISSSKSTARPQNNEMPSFQLPKSWNLVLSHDLLAFVTSGSRGWAKYYSNKGAIFIRVGNLDRNTISLDFSEIQRVSPPDGAEGIRTKVARGDILISITADIGMIGLVEDELGEAYINQHVALARPLSGFSNEYLAWYLASYCDGYQQFLRLQRGATKTGLGLEDIRNVWIPFPPLAEQEAIVAQIKTYFTAIEEIIEQHQSAQAYFEVLNQSILAKAFRGELVPQDPDDEPASVLLERIRAEREKLNSTPKGKRSLRKEADSQLTLEELDP